MRDMTGTVSAKFDLVHQHIHNLFFFNYTATTEIYTLSLHDALPIYLAPVSRSRLYEPQRRAGPETDGEIDRKSTRLNSSHSQISYAVFCLKKKKENIGRDTGLQISHDCNPTSIVLYHAPLFCHTTVE